MAWGSFSTGGGGGGADTPTTAANVTYDNSTSKIDAGNVQEALDFVAGLTLPRLTVTIDAGSQLTITCGDEEITGQTDGEGTFTTNLPMLGEWTIQAQKDGQTATQTVEVEQVGQFYTVEMAYFSATLTATAVAGATVTATCGETVVTGQAAGNGQAALEIKLPGNYVVQATMANSYGNATSNSQAVNVVDNGGSYTATVKFIRLTVTIDAGSQITISKGDTNISLTGTGSDQVYLPSTGTWAVTASKDDLDASAEVECSAYQDYSVELAYIQEVLGDNSWEMIKRVADADEGANWWSVGDTKSIVLNGKIGILQANTMAIDVFILGFNHNASREGQHLIHFAIGKISGKQVALCDSQYNDYTSSTCFHMNSSDDNGGGWNQSYMRKTILGNSGSPSSPPANSLLAALPADLRAVMQSVNKYTDNTGNGSNSSGSVTATVDWLWLMAEFEVYGRRTYANDYEKNSQQQYDYFKAGNPKTFNNHNNVGSVVWAWSRSPHYDTTIPSLCSTRTGPPTITLPTFGRPFRRLYCLIPRGVSCESHPRKRVTAGGHKAASFRRVAPGEIFGKGPKLLSLSSQQTAYKSRQKPYNNLMQMIGGLKYVVQQASLHAAAVR